MSGGTTGRWARAQRFEISAVGALAVQSYRAALSMARATGGRHAFDEACAGWAAQYALSAEDALGLCELEASPLTLTELVSRLDGYGPDAKSLRITVDRLVARGLVVQAARASSE